MPGQSNSVGRVDDDGSDILDQSPELPSAGQRWTVRRKAAVVEGVRGGWMPIEEACRLYNISVDEFLAWERDIDRNGIPGLRGAPVIKSVATQTFGGADVTRTENRSAASPHRAIPALHLRQYQHRSTIGVRPSDRRSRR